MSSPNATTIGGLPALVYGDKSTAKSACVLFHGTGERGSDLSALLKIEFIQKFESGNLPAGRLIIIPQLPLSQTGWWQNTVGPVMNDVAKNNLPIDGSGYSLGGIAIGDAVPDPGYGQMFRSAMTACGKIDLSNPNCLPAFRKIPSVHYYDPMDTTVNYGYQNISAMVKQLLSEGKKDIALVQLKGTPTPHNIWNQVYEGLYWDWLNALEAGLPAPAIPDPVISMVLQGVNLILTTQSGKKITITPGQISS